LDNHTTHIRSDNILIGIKMKYTAIFTALLVFTLTACDNKEVVQKPFVTPEITASTPLPDGHPPLGETSQTLTLVGAGENEDMQTATVISVIDIPQFSYIEISQNHEVRWIATSSLAAKEGDIIEFDGGSTMENFTSKTLDRTFPSMTFVNNASIKK